MTSEVQSKSPSWLPIVILCSLFFIFGFVTWLNGTLIQYFTARTQDQTVVIFLLKRRVAAYNICSTDIHE